jgi:hypothetical protein
MRVALVWTHSASEEPEGDEPAGAGADAVYVQIQ